MTSIDNCEAGPGSYNISGNLLIKSQIYPNPPRPIINKGKKNPSLYFSNAQSKEWLCSCSPPSNYYSPSTISLFKSSSSSTFGHEQRKDYFLSGRDRSPGPIYSYPSTTARGASFGKGIKTSFAVNDVPSPGTYNPKALATKLPIKIKGSSYEKVYSKNYEKYYKGMLGPGPAGYSIQIPNHKSISLSKAIKVPDSNL
jgi:hypothetical protein